MTILITGGTGQVGWELRQVLVSSGRKVTTPGREVFDFEHPEKFHDFLMKIRPQWIINAAAYTAVDKAETQRELAFAINAEAPRVIAQFAADLNIPIIHYSTDYVFDGSGDDPFSEEDKTAPINVYGESKLAGEIAIRETCSKHLIFRTSWVYSLRGSNFLQTMRRLMVEREELHIINDQIGAPTWSRHIAEATAIIINKMELPIQGSSRPWGTYHLTNDGETSWFGFAQAIMNTLPLEKKPRVMPITSGEYKTLAQRPLNSRLSNKKLKDVFNITLSEWRNALKQLSTGY